MRRVVTDDGSVTFFSEDFGEHYHSTVGAILESREKYIVPVLENLDLSGRTSVHILDFCFGLGYNTWSAVAELRSRYPALQIFVLALENDVEILRKVSEVRGAYSGPVLELIDAFVGAFDGTDMSLSLSGVDFSLVVGDARSHISGGPYDIVLFDPFSPKVCPELWTLEVFQNIYECCASPCVLATYSCARVVRDNLVAAGFTVRDGPVIGRRAPSTLAMRSL